MSNSENNFENEFKNKGYYLAKNVFNTHEINEALTWFNKQDPNDLVKSWTEKEPQVLIAVYSVIHNNDDPISKICNNKKMLNMASQMMGEEVYIWSSKINVKAAWCGTAEYYHQDLVYWKDRGYPKDEMLSCMVFMEDHKLDNAALHVVPGSHKNGFVKHVPFININGLAKFMIPPEKMNEMYKKNGLEIIEASPGDVLFFHTSLIHGSSHNISPKGRMIILSQLNTIGNEPVDVNVNARQFNLNRAKLEKDEAERRLAWFNKKYQDQEESMELTFSAPIPNEEK